jgi:hypothetical protein
METLLLMLFIDVYKPDVLMIRLNFILVLLFLMVHDPVFSQPLQPAEHGFQEFSLPDSELGTIRFYLDTTGIQRKKPIFLEVNGSGGLPLCIL